MQRRLWGAVVALLVAVIGGVVALQHDGGSPGGSGAGGVAAGRQEEPAPATGALADVPAAEPGTLAGYSRERFADWKSTGHGCTVRDAIIVRDSGDQPGESAGPLRRGCYPTRPHLRSPYRGSVQDGVPPGPEWLDGRRAVQIDHRIPLGWAWRQGAADWPATERAQFANDPVNLTAASSHDNESKNDEGPSTWTPEIDRCGYARGWVAVLVKYHLTIGRADRAALAAGLRECPS